MKSTHMDPCESASPRKRGGERHVQWDLHCERQEGPPDAEPLDPEDAPNDPMRAPEPGEEIEI